MKKYKNQVEESEQRRLERNQRERSDGGRSAEGEHGAPITLVEPESIAGELGIKPGARLLTINGRPVRDAIQIKMADSAEIVRFAVRNHDGATAEFEIEKDSFTSLGMGFDAELFDGVKRCVNKCPFCFVDQLPARVKGARNLRRTLYVRDDDFRLSFLHGHYITLTNLKDSDFARIVEEKLSPLYVSVHATEPELRSRMVGHRDGGAIMERLRFLIDQGIRINAQIVLCPEWNDGAHLDRSIADLMTLWPGVESVAVVPVGLTRFMPAERGLRTVTGGEASAVLRQLAPHRKHALECLGTRFVYASDELYLLAARQLPSTAHYEEFAQYANGVGTIRVFQDEVAKLCRRRPGTGGPSITMVTGSLAAPFLRHLAAVLRDRNIADASVAEVRNTFWGGNVACAGLLMGEEILSSLEGRDCGQFVFLPPDAVDGQRRMLDDITLDELSARLGSVVRADANGPLQLAEACAGGR